MNLSDAQRTKAWPTRRLRYGEAGHCRIRVSRLRQKAKLLRSQGKVASVSREMAPA